MKISNLHALFKVTLDKNAQAASFGGSPAFLPEEIDHFLNQGYIEVLSNKFTGQNVQQKPFEGSVKRISDLERLVKTDVEQALNYESSSNVLTLDNFFKDEKGKGHRMFLINAVLRFKDGVTNCELVDHRISKRFLKTYNNDPWIDTPVVTLADNQLNVFIDAHKMHGPFNIDVTYVKYPERIDHKNHDKDITEVPEYVLYEVINRAAVIALENTESQRAQTKGAINNLQE